MLVRTGPDEATFWGRYDSFMVRLVYVSQLTYGCAQFLLGTVSC